MNRLRESMKRQYHNAFRGNGQNLNAYNAAHANEVELRQLEMGNLESQKKALKTEINRHNAQNENSMAKLNQVEAEITNLKNYTGRYSLKGGKRTKRTKRVKRATKRATKRTTKRVKRSYSRK